MLWSADGENSAVVGLIVCAAIGEGQMPMTKNVSTAQSFTMRERECSIWATCKKVLRSLG